MSSEMLQILHTTGEVSFAKNSSHRVAVTEIIISICKSYSKLGRSPPEFCVFLNDLPGNDFNTLFTHIPAFQDKLRQENGPESPPCFVTAVPASFYGRLFPSNSLNCLNSSFSLHWLSQGVIEEESVDSYNTPYYEPCTEEVKDEIEKEGSFEIEHLGIKRTTWNDIIGGLKCDRVTTTRQIVKSVRVRNESMIQSHFGSEILDALSERFCIIMEADTKVADTSSLCFLLLENLNFTMYRIKFTCYSE